VLSRGFSQNTDLGSQPISGKKWIGQLDNAEVIVVSNAIQVASYEYRARNIAKAFALNGYKVCNMEEFDFINSHDLPNSVRLVYFCRTSTVPRNIKCWERIRTRVRIAFDVDDLIFLREVYNEQNAPGLLEIPEKARKHLTNEYIDIQREIIMNCDFLTAPTNAIVEAYASLTNVPAFIVPNVLPDWMISQSLDMPINQNSDEVVLGYASGTATHSCDFATAAPGIWEALRKNPNAMLKILGSAPLEAADVPRDIKGQVVFKKLVPHEELMAEIATFDINLAPLEINAFTEAKSELKYIHAALLGIPTVATPTDPFARVVISGKNGFLASTFSEWESSLDILIKNENLRKSMGMEAYLSLRSKYTIQSIARILVRESAAIWTSVHE
jgi:glycosyltransferase involved in cell wall biosynthesis